MKTKMQKFTHKTGRIFFAIAVTIVILKLKKWDDIQKIPPLELRWDKTSIKPAARPVNTALWVPVEKELKRFLMYLWEPSR
jgi:hypothetical protein